MKSFLYSHLLIIVFSTIVLSCSNNVTEPAPDITKNGSLLVAFENKFGSENFELLNRFTLNDSITLIAEDFKYYVSNIVLHNSNGSKFVIPKDSSYFLINQAQIITQSINLQSIPEGDYSSLSFILGIDSAKSVSPVGERTGVLDVAGEAKSMYWTWNSGYIFFALEGTYSSPKVLNNSFKYHIGGFGGYNAPNLNNIKNITIPFGNSVLKIRNGKKPHVHITADVSAMFKGDGAISIEANPTVMFSPYSVNVANKYATMFRFGSIME